MKSFLVFVVILTTISLIGYNAVSAESVECRNVVCPNNLENTNCPPDSRPILIDTNKINSDHDSTNYDLLSDNFNNGENGDIDNTRMLSKRSVQFTPRESIKIVAGGYISKRSLPEDEASKENERVIEMCCPQIKCVCKQDCDIPKCDGDLIPIGNLTTGEPGDCCPEYTCQEIPDCNDLYDQYVWVQPCKSCRCLSNETFCHMLHCAEEVNTVCKVENKPNVYLHEERWMEDPCTSCICLNGKAKCETSICHTPTCEKKIQLTGECCPVCDYNDTQFCNGDENCDIACKFDYLKSEHGCLLCKCAPPPVTITTTLQTNEVVQIVAINSTTERSTLLLSTSTTSSIDMTDNLISYLQQEIQTLNKKLKMQKDDLNFWRSVSVLAGSIIALIVIAIVLYCKLSRGCNRCNSTMYKSVRTSIDSNSNNVPKSKK